MSSVQMHETLMRNDLSDFCNHLGARKKKQQQQNIRLGENHVPQKISLYRQNEPADGFNK